MRIKFTIDVELQKTTGKFMSKEDVAEEIREELEGTDPGTVEVDETEYEIIVWEVSTS